MRIVQLACAALLAFSCGPVADLAGEQQQAPIVSVETDDPEMEAAKAQGRATLPGFLERLKNPAPGEGHFAIKFMLDAKQISGGRSPSPPTQAESPTGEFIWASKVSLSPDGSTVNGILDNIPQAKGFYAGQKLAVPIGDIIDWGYSKNGVMQGNFTTKALLSKMPPEEAAQVKQVMGWE